MLLNPSAPFGCPRRRSQIAVESAAPADVSLPPIAATRATASAVLFLFNVIETKFLRASSTSEFSHRLDPDRTFRSLALRRPLRPHRRTACAWCHCVCGLVRLNVGV